ncbi:MAG: methyltransferase family protein [Alphaproteobacteria bacterium]
MIKKLELLIAPPLVALLFALVAWFLAEWLFLGKFGPTTKLVAWGFIGLGLYFGVRANIDFRLAKTSLNPRHPNEASVLVTSGVFATSRNPMYLGLFLLLMGFGLMLESWWSLCLPILFLLYIQKFQIIPEERILQKKFGKKYSDYCQAVRRWF